MEKIYPIFEHIRREKKFSHKELRSWINDSLPEELKVSLPTVVAWCQYTTKISHRKPDISRLKYLAKLFKKPIDYFLYPEDYFDGSNGSIKADRQSAATGCRD